MALYFLPRNDVPDFTIPEIARVKNRLKVILVSARMPQAMTYLQERLQVTDQPIICYNGALVIKGTKEVFSETIDFKAIENVYRIAENEAVKLGLYYAEE